MRAALAPREWKLLVLELAVGWSDGVLFAWAIKLTRGSCEPREASSAACGGDMGGGGDDDADELDGRILTLPGAANKAGQMVAMVRQPDVVVSFSTPGPRAALYTFHTINI